VVFAVAIMIVIVRNHMAELHTKFLCMLLMVLARSSFGGDAICHTSGFLDDVCVCVCVL